MKIILLLSLVWAGPAKKAAPEDVVVQESYSVASLGLEAEAFRIQTLKHQGKASHMVAKLVNGQLFLEKPIKVGVFNKMKSLVQPLLTQPSSEDCKTPMRLTYVKGGESDQLKLCHEQPVVGGPMDTFKDEAKAALGLDK